MAEKLCVCVCVCVCVFALYTGIPTEKVRSGLGLAGKHSQGPRWPSGTTTVFLDLKSTSSKTTKTMVSITFWRFCDQGPAPKPSPRRAAESSRLLAQPPWKGLQAEKLNFQAVFKSALASQTRISE